MENGKYGKRLSTGPGMERDKVNRHIANDIKLSNINMITAAAAATPALAQEVVHTVIQ